MEMDGREREGGSEGGRVVVELEIKRKNRRDILLGTAEWSCDALVQRCCLDERGVRDGSENRE